MGAGFQARILAHAVSLAGLGTYEGPEGVLLPITAEQLGQVTSGTADEATLDLYARSIAHGLVHVADATVARPREQEMMLASFAAGAARNYTSHESCVCPMFQARSLLVGGWLVNGRNCRDVKRYHSTLLGNEKGIERKTYILEHPHSNLVNWERFRTRFSPRTAPLLVVKGFFQPIRRETAWSRKNSAVLWGVWANQNSHSGKLIWGVP